MVHGAQLGAAAPALRDAPAFGAHQYLLGSRADAEARRQYRRKRARLSPAAWHRLRRPEHGDISAADDRLELLPPAARLCEWGEGRADRLKARIAFRSLAVG